MKARTKRILLVLVAAMLLCTVWAISASAVPTEITAVFTDSSFRAAVYDAIGKTAPEPIYDTDLTGVRSLSVYEGAQNLAGLEHFTNLTSLYCSGNPLTQLPALPSSLETLYCSGNQLAQLPALPSNLETLNCNNNQLAQLPTLPSSLKFLYCNLNRLTQLPTLPSGLRILSIANMEENKSGTDIVSDPENYNAITSFPALPSNLESLICGNVPSLSVPAALPSSLNYLDCRYNQWTALPALPSGLRDLNCSYNSLTTLPALPPGLGYLRCNNNALTALPTLPSALRQLICGNNLLGSLPTLPSGLTNLGCSGNQLTALPAVPSDLYYLSCNDNQLSSLPTLPPDLGYLNCGGNLLTALDVTGLSLWALDCSRNNMTNISAVIGFTGTWGKVRDEYRYIYYPQNVAQVGVVPIIDITGVPTTGIAGTPLILSGTIFPSEATNQTIAWSVASAGTTGAVITGSTLNTTAVGTVKVKATIVNGTALGVNYEEEFNIGIGTDITAKFIDLNFRAAVYEVIGKTAPEPIYSADVARIQYFPVYGTPYGGYDDITSLAGIEYFTGMTEFDCRFTKIASLPALPSSLELLDCGDNQFLTTLSTLPPNLESLFCANSNLTALPTLPSSLTTLWCIGNQLATLPALPPNLGSIYCQDNKIASLPTLPPSLWRLECSNNLLSTLPSLPTSLQTLFCDKNQLTSLPSLPPNLSELNCNDNRLTSLPTLPSRLWDLKCSGNRLASLPTLPSGLGALDCRNNQLTTINVTGLSDLWMLKCSYNFLPGTSAVYGFNGTWGGRDFIFFPQNDVPPAITGPTSLSLAQGYSATSTGAYTITGNPAPTITLNNNHDGKITWNNSTKKLDIAVGLSAGTYPVTLTASNGVSPNATASFTLTVSAAQVTNYTVTYNTDGGTPSIAPVTVASGTSITLPAAPTKSKSIFKGWKTGSTTLAVGANYTVTGNVTFTAQWAKTIFSTKYEATFLNWILFFLCFGFIWMWF